MMTTTSTRTATVLACLLAFALSAAPAPVRADAAVDAVLAQISSADPDLGTYSARVEFCVGLHTFPYLKKTVHGATYFKRPDKLEIVFDDLPAYAQRFKHVFVGLGTPKDWERKFEISLEPELAGSTQLKLTPKKRDGRLRDVHVFLDRATSLPARVVWNYRDGQIEMVQNFSRQNGHYVIDGQDAELHLSGVKAYVHTKITNYAFNVALDDALFRK